MMRFRELRGWLVRLFGTFRRRQRDREFAEELESHLALHIEDNLRAGMSPEEARRKALIKLGGVTQIQELHREQGGLPMIETLVQDLRFGVRMLRKHPGFTLIAVLTLALGIGANIAIFSVVNAVLLRSLPYQNADELVAIYATNQQGEYSGPLSPVTYLNLKQQNSVFTEMVAISNKGWAANLTGVGEPERLRGFQVSANLFQMLGVAAAQGRTFVVAEDQPGNNRVVVLSHECWQRSFGGKADLVGSAINLNGAAYTVIGVMPPDFRLAIKTDAWTTLAFTPKDEMDDAGYLEVMGRRKPGVATEQARAEIANLYRRQLNNPQSNLQINLKPLQEVMVEEHKRMLWVLFAAVGFVLLIACANVANLLLARASVRRRELAIRAALGAGRWRVARQLLSESLLLAVLGAACGLVLVHWGIQFLVSGLPEYLVTSNAHVALLKLDGWALSFTLGLTLLTTMFFGLLPALQSSKVNLNETLKDGGRSEAQGRGPNRLRSLLVVTEIALAMILLVGAGLMLKSFWRLSHVNPGFESTGVLTANLDPTYKEFHEVVGFYQQLLERVSAIPGVEQAGIINSLGASLGFTIDEHPPVAKEHQPYTAYNQVSGDYFRTLNIPLRAGRFFNDRDIKGAPLVAIIDETLARRYFPNEDPLGKRVTLQNQNVAREIVGVAGATKLYSLTEQLSPHLYLPYQQENWRRMQLVVRAQADDPLTLIPALRREVAALNPNLPLHSAQLLAATVDKWSASERFTASLLAIFAGLAALLAALGIYGVLAYSISQRTHEIGIRMALGAQPHDVLRLVLRQGLWLTLTGIALGLLASLWLTQLMTKLLYEVSPTDPLTFVVIGGMLTLVALVACWIPARRAAKVDPLIALRHD